MIGNHLIKSWSSSQSVIALSSGEAELYAMTKAASQTIGLMSLAADFGEELTGEVMSDASAAIGIVHRKGLGKIRHIEVQDLWLQEKVAQEKLAVSKVAGAQNPADMMTKIAPAALRLRHMHCLGLHHRYGQKNHFYESLE